MAPTALTRGAARYYPSSATEIEELSLTQRRLKLARHSPCSGTHASTSREGGRSEGHVSTRSSGRIHNSRRGTPADEKDGHGQYFSSASSSSACSCGGYRPPTGVKVKSLSIHTQSAAALDDAQWGWDICACGHDIGAHGVGTAASNDHDEEFTRRAKVALRMDELLEDNHKLLDFDYDDEDLVSLRKQVLFSRPDTSTPVSKGATNGASLKRKSRSPSESRLSSIEPSVPSREASASRDSPWTKRRRMQSRSRTASRAASPASQPDGQGHGKKPTQAQKTLPETQDEQPTNGTAPNGITDNGFHSSEREDVEEVKMTPADIDRISKGVSLDTEAPQPGDAQQPTDDLDESAPPIRERPAVIEERSGLIQFRVVTNDGKPESMIILTGLKNIFQRQLPKMPREYITRLVMDRNHWSMAIVKRGLQVVGGITYRPFNSRRFAEIVFCAITSTEQVKGYGSHLMNHIKDYVKSASDVMHFLTYADNYAIGYFKKQGFSKEISLDRSIWVGYIKDYEGGTLMQCSMLPRVEYLKARELLASQRQLILSKIRSISKSHIIYPGLDVFREPKPKVEEKIESNDPTAHFRIDPSEVPGLKESAWTVEMDELSRRPRRGPHHNLMRHILVEMSNHQAAWPFANPVNAQEVPDYYEVIKEPMDLSTMEVKLENNQYASLDDLLHDAQLIFDNCRMYNPPTSVYAKSANRLERFVKDSLQAWKQQAGIL